MLAKSVLDQPLCYLACLVKLVQSMTFAIAYGGRVRHRATIRHNIESDGRILRENWC
ncbi:MAG: hypothetical protein V7K50_06120 [Nostoc sp.]|uniref:hypothetical protein n=1 Tax=Nostoc sp. TaxID=1180 RepID=UPI002FFC28C4